MERAFSFPARTEPAWAFVSCGIAPKSSGRPWICRARSITAPKSRAFLTHRPGNLCKTQIMAELIHNETRTEAETGRKISPGKAAADKSRIFIVDDHTMFR